MDQGGRINLNEHLNPGQLPVAAEGTSFTRGSASQSDGAPVVVPIDRLFYRRQGEEGDINFYPGLLIFHQGRVQAINGIFDFHARPGSRGTGYFHARPGSRGTGYFYPRYHFFQETETGIAQSQQIWEPWQYLGPVHLTEIALHMMETYEPGLGMPSAPGPGPSAEMESARLGVFSAPGPVPSAEMEIAPQVQEGLGIARETLSTFGEGVPLSARVSSPHQIQPAGPSSAPEEAKGSHLSTGKGASSSRWGDADEDQQSKLPKENPLSGRRDIIDLEDVDELCNLEGRSTEADFEADFADKEVWPSLPDARPNLKYHVQVVPVDIVQGQISDISDSEIADNTPVNEVEDIQGHKSGIEKERIRDQGIGDPLKAREDPEGGALMASSSSPDRFSALRVMPTIKEVEYLENSVHEDRRGSLLAAQEDQEQQAKLVPIDKVQGQVLALSSSEIIESHSVIDGEEVEGLESGFDGKLLTDEGRAHEGRADAGNQICKQEDEQEIGGQISFKVADEYLNLEGRHAVEESELKVDLSDQQELPTLPAEEIEGGASGFDGKLLTDEGKADPGKQIDEQEIGGHISLEVTDEFLNLERSQRVEEPEFRVNWSDQQEWPTLSAAPAPSKTVPKKTKKKKAKKASSSSQE